MEKLIKVYTLTYIEQYRFYTFMSESKDTVWTLGQKAKDRGCYTLDITERMIPESKVKRTK